MEGNILIKNGKEKNLELKFSSIAELLRSHASRFDCRDALISVDVDTKEEYALCYSEIEKLAYQTANFLYKQGVAKGDRVAFAFHNTALICILELSCGLLGAASVPLDVKRDAKERKIFKLQDSQAKMVIARIEDEAIAQEFYEIANAHPLCRQTLVKNDQEFFEKVQQFPEKAQFQGAHSAEQEYILLYTSGTTANPKGVPLSLRACMANAQGIAQWQNMDEKDRFLIVLPLHHINSTTMSLATLVMGGTIILMSRYSASQFWGIAAKEQATLTSVVPTILHDLLARKDEFLAKNLLLSFKRILVGSAPVLPEETLRFMECFSVDVVQGYGQTETALRVTGVPADLPRDFYLELVRTNSIGKELAWCNVAILKEDGSMAGENEEGEICIRGPVLGEGYLNSQEETAAAFRKGWFHSGDLGFWKQVNEEQYFFIKGRIKEIIIKGGVNISPSAVEDALLKNFDELDEVAVIGFEDSRMGEEIAAVATVQKSVSQERAKELEIQIVRLGLEGKIEGLSRYESPVKALIVKENLPKTSTGKIQRVKVKEMVKDALAVEKSSHPYCRLILPAEDSMLKEAVSINNERWSIPSSFDEFRQRSKNGYLVGVFDEQGVLQGSISCLQATKKDLMNWKTWNEATANGTLSTSNPAGDILLCAAISVRAGALSQSEQTLAHTADAILEKRFGVGQEGEEQLQKFAADSIEEYAKSNLDNVLRFHRKAKGGFAAGAEVIEIMPESRPEDKDALGYNILMEYPRLEKEIQIRKTPNAHLSTMLIEHAMTIAKENGCTRVLAFSRPAQLRLHIAKAFDETLPLEIREKEAFAKLVHRVQ
ncbi:MAG: hypothetical protein A3E07_03775 [Candidatus Wildermuthbacteria bacterium RIFCSPHIGHO2_12_FULL_45_9]|nr:MAG: hypothetical protein A2748_01810 [Candidatus Wildermuthbacteria bacterium RIFCSPHIGHO2_01_FULL_45_20]OHA72138.1 MAG: hypothetical protein A3E07_03775 [Candidatus Wildermuthbacteria bacterium RIFCSPHIGHO2_12_FULL_45_9]